MPARVTKFLPAPLRTEFPLDPTEMPHKQQSSSKTAKCLRLGFHLIFITLIKV